MVSYTVGSLGDPGTTPAGHPAQNPPHPNPLPREPAAEERDRGHGRPERLSPKRYFAPGQVALNPDPMGPGKLVFTAPSTALTSSKIIINL